MYGTDEFRLAFRCGKGRREQSVEYDEGGPDSGSLGGDDRADGFRAEAISRQTWRRWFAIMVLMLVFLVILCFSILFMYAASHPEGLVIFSQENLLNTQSPTTPASPLAGNDSHRVNRKPQGVTVVPVDPWWIRLAETESPLPTNKDPTENNVDWVGRVRVKVANETTKAHTKPITKPAAFTSTTTKPKPTTRTTAPPKSHDIPEYDENAIIYNYKSYETSVVQGNADP